MKKECSTQKETRMAHHADARNNTFCNRYRVKAAGKSPLEGRWDMTIDWNGKPAPGWLSKGTQAPTCSVGQVVINFGSARPVARVTIYRRQTQLCCSATMGQGDKDLVLKARWRRKHQRLLNIH